MITYSIYDITATETKSSLSNCMITCDQTLNVNTRIVLQTELGRKRRKIKSIEKQPAADVSTVVKNENVPQTALTIRVVLVKEGVWL